MRVIDHGGLAVFEMQGNLMTGLATPGQGAQQIEAWSGTMQPGAATPVHVHDAEEVIVVVRGRGELRVGSETVAFQAPCTLIAPPHIAHEIVNTGAEPMETIAVMPARCKIATADGQEPALPWRR